jgi:hypothetical protein
MNAPTSSSAPADELISSVEAEISKLVEKKTLPTEVGSDAERIRSSIARLTSTSVDGLEGLMSEVQQLQTFLKSEVERVQRDIETSLTRINIIIETIAPWKPMLVPTTPPRSFRAGPASIIEAAQPRR